MSDSDSVFSGDSPLQRADRAKFSLFRKQRTALRAGSFGFGCRHVLLLVTRILPVLSSVAHEKNRLMNAACLKDELSGTIWTLL
jgi:hypothetical protein